MKYKALIYYGPFDFRFEERELPQCGDNDIIVRNLCSSICGSDSDTWLNGGELHLIPPGEDFGHEVVCEIAACGKKVEGLKVGDRIAPYTGAFTPNPMKGGYLGGFSEYMYGINAKDGVTLFKLDDSLSNKKAALIEPMSVSVNAADKAVFDENTKVMILGAGIIGFGIGARLAQKGLPRKNITFVEKSELRVKLVRDEGFHAVCTKEEDWKEKLLEYTGTTYSINGLVSDADYIFDAAGSIDPKGTEPTLLEQAFDWAKYGSQIYVVGVHRQSVNFRPTDFVFCCYNVRSAGGASLDTTKEAIAMLQSNIVDFEKVVTHVFPYEKAIEAIQLSCNTDECMKVEIEF